MFESVCGPTVAAVQAADPSRLADALFRVSQDALGAMSADEAECVIAATQRILNAVTARKSAALTRYTEHVHDTRDGQRAARDASGEPAPVGAPTPVQEAAAALAPILRIAPRTMATRIHTAHTLTDLPRTAAMGWAGDLEPYRASVITQAARQVGHEQLSEFEARLHHGDITELPGSRVKTRAGLIATRLAPAPDPEDPEQDNAPASDADRGVRVGPAEQAGLTKWDALLPTDSSLSMCAAIDTLAAQYRQDNPRVERGSVRADALVDLVLSDVQVTTTATLIIPTTTPRTADRGDPADAGRRSRCGRRPRLPGEPSERPVPSRLELVTLVEPVRNRRHRCGDRRRPPVDPAGGLRLCRAVTSLARPAGAVERRGAGGPWAQQLPDPPLQDRYARIVAQANDADANPHLARDRPRAGLVRAQGGHRRPGRAAATGAGQRDPGRPGHHHPPGRSPPAHRRRRTTWTSGPTAPAPSWPGWCAPGMAPVATRAAPPLPNGATWTTSSPTRPVPRRRPTCRRYVARITGSSTTAAGPSP